MTPNAADSGRATFFLNSPRDLLNKLHFEMRQYWAIPATNLTDRAYVILNAATTGWHMRDWVYAAVKRDGLEEVLDELVGRHIKSASDFGAFLCADSQWLRVCYHVATSTKHFRVRDYCDPSIRTLIEEDARADELWVTCDDTQMLASSLMHCVLSYWELSLRRLTLYDEPGPFLPSTDSP